MIEMDGAHHRVVRAAGANWFRPKAMRVLKGKTDALAKRCVDEMSAGTECDFVTDIAVHYPLDVITSLLGLPEADAPYILKLTQENFGRDDGEFQRGDSHEDFLGVIGDSFDYFTELAASRRSHPTDDPASAIAKRTHRRQVPI